MPLRALRALRAAQSLYIAKRHKPRARVLLSFSFLLLFQMVPGRLAGFEGHSPGDLGWCYLWLVGRDLAASQARSLRLSIGVILRFCDFGLQPPVLAERRMSMVRVWVLGGESVTGCDVRVT
jgi:hypothetical protein